MNPESDGFHMNYGQQKDHSKQIRDSRSERYLIREKRSDDISDPDWLAPPVISIIDCASGNGTVSTIGL